MTDLNQLKQNVIDIGRWVDSHHWCPATSGNLSARIDQQRILITVSGQAKGSLTKKDGVVEMRATGYANALGFMAPFTMKASATRQGDC